VDEKDIYRTANVLVKRHGSEASLFAAQRADELLEKGDAEGAVTWRRVYAAIGVLTDKSGDNKTKH